ncbi:MAG: MATE family efflux transporter [Rhodobacterales bacterium]|nr:MAG: MATE family efflux transporter [Rhodobacterales bacterium]
MGHVMRMSLTASVGLLAIFAVDFVDMVFISMLGNDALAAAVGYAATLLFFTNAINIGLSIAAGSLVARSIGAGDRGKAGDYATSVVGFAVITGVVVPVGLLINRDAVLALFGAEGAVLDLAARYVSFILPSMAVMGIAMTAMAVLRAHGDARRSMMCTLYGGGVNAVLDPLLIFAFGLGLDGAAIASVLARLTMAALALAPAMRVHQGFARPSLAGIMANFAAISAIALPAVLTNIATPVGNAIVTRQIAQFGTDAVAGMAVIGRLMPVAFAAIFALSGAIGPIIGQNFGAGRPDRVRGAFVAGVLFTGVYVLLVSALLFVLRAPIAALFDAQGQTRALIYLFCGPLALLSFFNGLIFVANASFNNLGHPIYSTWVNWGRHSIGTWVPAVIGAQVMGAAGVLIGQALGGVVFGLIAWMMVQRLVRASPAAAPTDAFAAQRREHVVTGRRGW